MLPLRILHVAAEHFPQVKTGGLGDVMASLPPAQRRAGMDVRLVLPCYPAVRAALIEPIDTIWVGPVVGSAGVRILKGRFSERGLWVYAVDAPDRFDRPGSPYVDAEGRNWPDNALRFALLSWTAAQLARGVLDRRWHADILHAHDWHTALAPAYARLAEDSLTPPRTVFTIHNLAYQGLFPAELFPSLCLPPEAFVPEGLEFWGLVSFMKAGLVYADKVTTVSPTYARDITTYDYGYGVVMRRGTDLVGILNGVDEKEWDPSRDPHLVAGYSRNKLSGKADCRAAVAAEYSVELGEGPLFCVVSRLTHQKGLDLVLATIPEILAHDGRLIVLGEGDRVLELAFRAAADAHPGKVGAHFVFSEAQAHRVIAGADALLMPSRFEPCGLTQLYALHYGTPPVVHHTGGLLDTVIDVDSAGLALGTGFAFKPATVPAFAEAIGRAATLFNDPRRWRQVQRNAMAQHFLWSRAAEKYLELYRSIAVRTGTY
jgi:starch synthase